MRRVLEVVFGDGGEAVLCRGLCQSLSWAAGLQLLSWWAVVLQPSSHVLDTVEDLSIT